MGESRRMRIYSNAEFHWKNNKLYLGKKGTGFSVFNAEEDLYWMKWPDGIISADYYNLSRAKDNCRQIALTQYNNNTKNDTQMGSTCV